MCVYLRGLFKIYSNDEVRVKKGRSRTLQDIATKQGMSLAGHIPANEKTRSSEDNDIHSIRREKSEGDQGSCGREAAKGH